MAADVALADGGVLTGQVVTTQGARALHQAAAGEPHLEVIGRRLGLEGGDERRRVLDLDLAALLLGEDDQGARHGEEGLVVLPPQLTA